MATQARNSSGVVGLGSRLFLFHETAWGDKPDGTSTGAEVWQQYNIYNQPGGRPQKTMTSIDVPQLFPSMLRRKPLTGSTSVAGSYVFGLPKSNFSDFARLVLGDTTATPGGSGGATIAQNTNGTLTNVSATDFTLVLETANGSLTSVSVGDQLVLSAFDTGSVDDTLELANINTTHTIATIDVSSDPEVITFTSATAFDLNQLTGVTTREVNTQTVSGGTALVIKTIGTEKSTYDMQTSNDQSWSMIQTIGLERLALYTGMKAQSATLNVTADSVVTMDIAFMGKDEETRSATDANADILFGSTDDNPLTFDSNGITGVSSAFDNWVDYYPSWSATLYIGKKTNPGSSDAFTTINNTDAADDIEAATHIVPFSDMSITINNNLDFPAYINGTKARNEPVQTTYREVTGSMTVPYNEHTEDLVQGYFDQTHYKALLKFTEPGTNLSLAVDLPEFCIVGDGGLGNVPEGEVTLPISFGAYAGVSGSPGAETYLSTAPISFIVDETSS